MRERTRLVVALSVVLGAALGARAWAVDSDPGICAHCHETPVAAGGHAASLDCTTCHEDRRPGIYGRRHRAIPTSCTSHHTIETHPPMDRPLGPARLQRSCLKCHDVHGSENAHLVRTTIRTRGQLHPIDFVDPTAFVDVAKPGNGLCEVCHTKTKFYRANGKGQPHFGGDCTLCHDHTAGFRPVVTDENCAICHPAEAALLAKPTRHNAKFAGRCSSCHVEVSPLPGPGHRAIAACEDCHSAARVADHVPPGIRIPCTQCHDAHGSDNIRLMREMLHTAQGTDVPLVFTNVDGRADGSFASASAPGTGLCEVCHTRTMFYRADGSGGPHYVTPCSVCHPHVAGFLPD